MVNSQKNCWLGLSPQYIPIAIKSKHQVPITVFGVITNDGYVMPPFIFLNGFRINTNTYVKCLLELMLSFILKVAAINRLPIIWESDLSDKIKRDFFQAVVLAILL